MQRRRRGRGGVTGLCGGSCCVRTREELLTRRQHTVENGQRPDVAPSIRQLPAETQFPRRPLDVTHDGPSRPVEKQTTNQEYEWRVSLCYSLLEIGLHLF